MQPPKNLFNIFLHQVNKGNINISYTLFKKFAGGLILRNISRKLKSVTGNAIRIKIKIEFGFHLKVNVCKFRRNKNRPGKQSHRRQLFESGFFKFFSSSESFVRIGNLLLQFVYFYDCLCWIFFDFIRDCCQ